MKKILLSIITLTINIILVYSQDPKPIYKNSTLSIEKRLDNLLSLMTLEEKIGQMNQLNGFWDVTGPKPNKGNAKLKYELLKKGLIGSMLNVKGVDNIYKIQKIIVEESRLGIPLIFGFDVIHGYKTQSPIPLAESASWDLEAIKKSAQIAADEASASGLNWTFAPMVDISRDARWGRVMEGAGEDPYLGSKIAQARIEGFQGDNLAANNTIIACAKHFAAYGFAESGRDYNASDIGTSTLFNIVLPPFKAAVNAGVKTFMNSFNTVNGIPSTGNSFLQRKILKEKWNFDGFVVSDWGSIREMIKHGFAEDLKNSAELAANAGSDMDMESNAYITYLAELVRNGKVDEAYINDSAKRILSVKFELGLFDDPYLYCNKQREIERVKHPSHIDGVLEMAKKSIVLLKNDNNILPLKKEQKNIVIIGDLADDKNSPLGSWRLASDDNSAVSFLEGFKSFNSNYTFIQGPKNWNDDVTFRTEIELNTKDTTGMGEAIKASKQAELVIMILGEHGFMSGEGRSRTDIGLPGLQKDLLKEVYKVNKNIVLVLMNGRPLTLNWEAENIPAILETWQLGSQTGNAIAQVLFGEYNPSGKLPMSFPKKVGQLPIYYNHLTTGRPLPEEPVFWSHYIDSDNSPQFPFGYGLSYTSFKYDNLKIDASNKKAIQVSITVTNQGPLNGEEVVQLYLSDPVASVVRPIKELKGFNKINLNSGESKTVNFTLTEKELGFYNLNYDWVVEPGFFKVMVGTNSQEGLEANFKI